MPPRKRKAAPKLLAIVEDGGDDDEMLGPSTSQPTAGMMAEAAVSAEAEIAIVIARATDEGGVLVSASPSVVVNDNVFGDS